MALLARALERDLPTLAICRGFQLLNILRGGDLKIAEDGSGITDMVRLVLNPIWNAFHFFTLYANADGYTARFRTDATGELDRCLVVASSPELTEAELAAFANVGAMATARPG